MGLGYAEVYRFRHNKKHAMNRENAAEGKARQLVRRFVPGVEAFSRYDLASLRDDLPAGLSVAAVALPVGIAYSQIIGVPAVFGIYAAVFPLIAYAFFGSSRQLMIGPDAATCILAAAILAPMAGGDPSKYLVLMVVLTLMAGALYILAGILRLGFIANFLSQPILVGFLNGISLLIIVGQIPKLFGYSLEAKEFFPKIAEIVAKLGETHMPTLILAVCMLVILVAMRRFVRRLPSALVVVIVAVVAVVALDLEGQGVVILGTVPAGMPSFRLPVVGLSDLDDMLAGAAGLVLVSFTSGVLTAKSFARRARERVDPNRELIAFGVGNLASGVMQGFPVTGADSRTAVNYAMGGKTQMVGLVAAGTMLLVLFFLTAPLALVPTAALAAVIIISAVHLFDVAALKELYDASRREFILCVGTTLGVLVVGVLPGVLLAVALSLVWLLMVGSRPSDAVLGRVDGMKGFHNVREYPEAKTVPGLLLYRFDSDLIFFNAELFRQRVREAIAAEKDPVEWVILDVSPINVIDFTAVQQFQELHQELVAEGIVLGTARARGQLSQFFRPSFVSEVRGGYDQYIFPTLRVAVKGFQHREVPEAVETASEEGAAVRV